MKKSRSPKGAGSGIVVRYERRGGIVTAFDISGHAGFALAGEDIICAAVSALIFSTSHGLREHCKQPLMVTNSVAQYSVRLAGKMGPCSQALLATMLSGLKSIARSYPGYIKVEPASSRPTGPRPSLAKPKGSRAHHNA